MEMWVNWRRGFLRAWAILAVVWVVLLGWYGGTAPCGRGMLRDQGSYYEECTGCGRRRDSCKNSCHCRKEKREFPSGPSLTAPQMVSRVRKLAQDWKYQVVSIGYPGPVLHNRPVAEPRNLASGWMGFNFEEAFKRPTKTINDAAMQALGSYRNGKMLFLGLGTGLGSTLIADGILEPMELGHLLYKKGTYELRRRSRFAAVW